MQSLIIPVVLLILVALWGAWETGRKFRREFARRGKPWEDVCTAMAKGEGMLVVDTIWGPQRGFGHPVIWWLPALAEGEEIGPHVESDAGSAKLVRCPRTLKSLEALRAHFGESRVVAHSWAVGAPRAASKT